MLFIAILAGCESTEVSPDDSGPLPQRCNTAFDPEDFPPATVSYRNDILPIFRHYGCTSTYCHGGARRYSLLDAVDALGPGTEPDHPDTCVVVRGEPDNSYLIKKLEGAEGISGQRMPPDRDPLSEQEIALVQRWILEGARDN